MLHRISLESVKTTRVDYNEISGRRRPSYLPGSQTELPLRTDELLGVRRKAVSETRMDSVFLENVSFTSKV